MIRNTTRNRTLELRAWLPALWIALLALPMGLQAQPPGAGDGPGFGRRGPGGGFFGDLGFLTRFLDLSEEQQQQARALRESLRQDSEALREQSRALREDLSVELDAETPDPTRVGELAIALHAQRKALQELRDRALADFEALLTQEQLESFQQLRQTLQERRQERRERRGHHSHP